MRCLWYELFFTSCPLGNTSFIGMFLPDFYKRKTQYRNDTESSYMMQERSPYRANGTANLYDPCYRIFFIIMLRVNQKRDRPSQYLNLLQNHHFSNTFPDMESSGTHFHPAIFLPTQDNNMTPVGCSSWIPVPSY